MATATKGGGREPAAPAATAEAGPRRNARRRRGSGAPYVLLAPAVLLLLAFLLLPVGYAGWLSLRANRVTGGGLLGRREEGFVGFENYASALTNRDLWDAMRRMAAYGLVVVPIMFSLALVFALLLDVPRVRLRSTARVIIFLPYAVPGVIASLLWGFIYMPKVSPIDRVFEWLGTTPPDFLGSGSVLFSVANVAIWGGTGFNMLILYTALRSIPLELYDAARIDGCGELRIAWHVKIPMLVPALGLTMIFALIAMIQVYNEPQALSSLTTAISSTWVPMMKIYVDAFVLNNVYAAAATSIMLALLTLAVSLGVLSLVNRKANGGGTR